uniref:Efflux protein n=1 Tax=Coccidioides posadasii RMSCC 3488 TaxID=454284 RepID=A0A0J6F763_COCPO|nr:efflux protein [Coccidioides posadasii RMSCC 3488]
MTQGPSFTVFLTSNVLEPCTYLSLQHGNASQHPSDGSSVSTVELRSLSSVPVEPATHKGRRVSDVQNERAAIPRSDQPSGTTESPPSTAQTLQISKAKAVTVIITLAGISFLNVMGSGILIAALPRIAKHVSISEGLILRPAAVYSLAAGCLLLMFGAVADIIGPKLMWVTGSSLFVAFTVAVSAARTGLQVILFRTCLGVAISMCLPTAVSLIANTFPKGTWRNVAFAMNGMGQPLGYALGLVLGGIFTDTIGWRWAYNMMSLPSVHHHSNKKLTRRLIEDVDWLGDIQNIVLLVVSGVLLVAFPCWMYYQVKNGRPALIHNKLLEEFFVHFHLHFCLPVFQTIQELSALQSSIRFLPNVIMGVLVNIVTAYFVARVELRTLGVISALITMIAPVLMATVDIDEDYWLAPFWALLFSPVNPDMLSTLSNLVISDSFPADIQSLAGGVFNGVSQFGNSLGLAATAAIAASVTEHSDINLSHKELVMKGYRSAFWTIFAATTLVVIVSVFVELWGKRMSEEFRPLKYLSRFPLRVGFGELGRE